jgi:hypothetical protein
MFISDPGSALKSLSILTQKKWFLSSRKYDPGCSSRIPDPDADFYPSRIPDPGVKKAPDPGSGFATLVHRKRKIEELGDKIRQDVMNTMKGKRLCLHFDGKQVKQIEDDLYCHCGKDCYQCHII